MILGDASTGSIVVATFLGSFATLLAAGIGGWPIYHRHQQRQADHRRRVEAACDATLGKMVDLPTGRTEFHPGLVHVIPLNGYKTDGVPTIMDKVSENTRAVEDLRHRIERRGD